MEHEPSRDRLRTTESPDHRKVAAWRLAALRDTADATTEVARIPVPLQQRTGELDAWLRDQLAIFHAETAAKLALAPVDSAPLYHADGSLCPVDEDGWPDDYDDLDQADIVTVEPFTVVDTEFPETR